MPSYDTSGAFTSPLPCVIAAVMLCSGALGDAFSRMIRSPPGAVGAPLVGLKFRPRSRTRLTYAIATSPCTVTVDESVLCEAPPPQALSASRPAAASAAAQPTSAFVEKEAGSFMVVPRCFSCG